MVGYTRTSYRLHPFLHRISTDRLLKFQLFLYRRRNTYSFLLLQFRVFRYSVPTEGTLVLVRTVYNLLGSRTFVFHRTKVRIYLHRHLVLHHLLFWVYHQRFQPRISNPRVYTFLSNTYRPSRGLRHLKLHRKRVFRKRSNHLVHFLHVFLH